MKDPRKALEEIVQLTNLSIGFTPSTPSGFSILAQRIKRVTGRDVSESTLKRIWGYVRYASFPSPFTLNTLAIFNGYLDWNSYLAGEKPLASDTTSGFFKEVAVNPAHLKTGDIVELNWFPDKSCRMEYTGDEKFHILESHNIKLMAGDCFKTRSISVGLPFYAMEIHRGERLIPGYIGARDGGITTIKIEKI